MIAAVGLDLVSVDRVRRAMQRPGFVERVLTPAERQAPLTPEYVAGRWAAKEALAKCMPRLIRWHDAEVISSGGKPEVWVAAHARLHPDQKVWLSISHERQLASAVAVIEVP